jgi:hypothetical protein
MRFASGCLLLGTLVGFRNVLAQECSICGEGNVVTNPLSGNILLPDGILGGNQTACGIVDAAATTFSPEECVQVQELTQDCGCESANTTAPSVEPTDVLTAAPVEPQTQAPITSNPTSSPTNRPTISPSAKPSISPSSDPPTISPSDEPSGSPATLFPTVLSFISYFDRPKVNWSVQLEDTGDEFMSKIGKGNSVTGSPENTLVYVTLDDGRLEVLASFDGVRRWGYKPAPIENGWEIQCRSGVYFGNLPSVGKYIVYAIIDISPSPLIDNKS